MLLSFTASGMNREAMLPESSSRNITFGFTCVANEYVSGVFEMSVG